MEIANGITGIDFNGRVWAYLIAEADRCTLIDTGIGGEYEIALEAMSGAGYRVEQVRQVILTHCHKDHTGLAARIRSASDATVLAHRLDAPVITRGARVADPVLKQPERAIAEHLSASIPEAEPTGVDRELEDSDEIEIAHDNARVIHLPGHTPGSIGVFLPSARILFTGDAAASLSGRPVTGFFNIDPDEASRSFARLAQLQFDIACFGHGAPLLKEASQAFRRTADLLAADEL